MLFSDQRCYNSIGICPSDIINVTCNASELTQKTLGVTIPPDEFPDITIFYSSVNNQIIPEGKIFVVSQGIQTKNGMVDYEITMSLTGSVLMSGPVVCSDGDYNGSATCRVAGEISSEVYVLSITHHFNLTDPPAIMITSTSVTCINVTLAPSTNGSECVDSYIMRFNSSLHEDRVDIEGDKPAKICHPSFCQALTSFTACVMTAEVEAGYCGSSVNYLSSTG